MEKRKKRFGDRYDGYRVRSLSPMSYIVPFIMKTRNDASNLFSGSVELGRIENYIKKKRREDGLSGFGFLHVVLAAYVRLVSQKPAMNRFVAGLDARDRRIFVQRYWYMCSTEQIARDNSMNRNTVTTVLYRTREKLRAFLEKEGVFI